MKPTLLILVIFLVVHVLAQTNPSPISFVQPQMVLIDGATFDMGNPVGKKNAKPVHKVALKGYYISKFELTQEIWYAVLPNAPHVKDYCAQCPIYDISWGDIQTFLTKLNQQTGKHYRLPTEAEWEYAASGGKQAKGYKYSGSNSLDEIAWYAPNANQKTHPVGQKKPNELGLYDMSGNVWELCSDWYHPDYYKHSPGDSPNNQKKGAYRVTRGGSWRSEEERCQIHARNRQVHDHNISNCGIRLVMDL